MTKKRPTDPSIYIPAILREAKTFIRHYGVPEHANVSLLHHSENTMLLVEEKSPARKLVLRVHSQQLSYHTTPSINSELRWLMALRRDTDIEVPEVVPATDGSLTQILSAPDIDQPRHTAMFTFLDGSEPKDDTLVEGFKRLGRITARMHLHARSWQAPADFVRHAWDPESIFGEDALWGRWQEGMGVDGAARRILDRMVAVVEKRLAKLGRDRDRYGLIHADLRLANLLVEGDRTKLIDFDDCAFSWYLYDLAGALSFMEERPTVPELIASWLEGYRLVASVPAEIEKEIPTFIMLRRMALLAWLGTRRHLEFAQSLGAGFTRDTCRLAEDYLHKLG